MAGIRTSLELFDNFTNRVSQIINKTDQLGNSFRNIENAGTINLDDASLTRAEREMSVIADKLDYQNRVVQNLGQSYSDASSKLGYQSTEAMKLENQLNNARSTQLKLEASYDKAVAGIQKEEAAARSIKTPIEEATRQQDKLNNSINSSSNGMEGFIQKARNLITTYLGFKAFEKVTDASDQFVLTRARLDLMNDGLQTTDQLQNMIFASAQRSRGAYTDTAHAVSKLGILAKDAFSSTQEIVGFSELMNKSFKIGGASVQEQTAGMYQLTQAMAAGKLQGDEFRSIMENAPMLAQAIAKFTGKSMGHLKQMSSEGAITASIIKGAMFSAADDINSKFNTLPRTWGEIGTSIKNQALMAFQPVLLKINEIANAPGFDALVNNTVNGLVILASVALNLFEIITNIAGFFQNNWSFVEPIIWGIVAAFIAYNAVSLVTSGILAIQAFMEGVAGAAMAMKTGATFTATVAQWGLNAALYACPITWIILAIIAFIVIIYIAVAAINHFAGTSYSATGFIMGCFFALGAFIYNIVAYIWNGFAAFAEFLINVFNNPVYSAKRLFANLAINVLDLCISMTKGFDSFATNMANAIIDGINIALNAWNSFVDILNSFGGLGDKLGLGKATTIEHTSSITSSLEGAKASINSWVGEAPSDYVSVPKMGMMNIGNEFQYGYNKGAGFASSIEKMFNGTSLLDSLTKDVGNSLNAPSSGLGVNDDGANKKLKNIDDKIDVSNEHLEMLRDLAEQESIQNFVTLTPTVQVTTGDIREEADINKIIAKIETYMETELENSAEGLYA